MSAPEVTETKIKVWMWHDRTWHYTVSVTRGGALSYPIDTVTFNGTLPHKRANCRPITLLRSLHRDCVYTRSIVVGDIRVGRGECGDQFIAQVTTTRPKIGVHSATT